MKASIFAGVGLLALAAMQPAAAADFKAPVSKAAVDRWSWSGGYIGGNLGYSWGSSRTTLDVSNSTSNAVLFSAGTDFSMNDFLVGGQAGANWQAENWLAGIEADIQGTAERGSAGFTCTAAVCNTSTPLAAAARIVSASFDQRLTWFGTVRGRLGAIPAPWLLAYLTGGLAYGKIETLGSLTGFTAAGAATTSGFNDDRIKAGWTVGLGIEGRINSNWTAKVEYLYLDLGNVATAAVLPANSPPLSATFNSRFTDNILRVGVNYKLDNGPVVAKY